MANTIVLFSSMLHESNHEIKRPPMGYAMVPNLDQNALDFYLRHEGVHMMTWDTKQMGFGYFDEMLSDLAKCCAEAKPHISRALSIKPFELDERSEGASAHDYVLEPHTQLPRMHNELW